MDIVMLVADELTRVSRSIYSPPLSVVKTEWETTVGQFPVVEIVSGESWAKCEPDKTTHVLSRVMLLPEGAVWNPNIYIDGQSCCRGPLQFSEPPFFRDLLINVHDAVMRYMDWAVRMLSAASEATSRDHASERQLEQLFNAMTIVDHRYLAYMTANGYLRLDDRSQESGEEDVPR